MDLMFACASVESTSSVVENNHLHSVSFTNTLIQTCTSTTHNSLFYMLWDTKHVKTVRQYSNCKLRNRITIILIIIKFFVKHPNVTWHKLELTWYSQYPCRFTLMMSRGIDVRVHYVYDCQKAERINDSFSQGFILREFMRHDDWSH